MTMQMCKLEKSRDRLKAQIARLNGGYPVDSHLAAVSDSFHLGRVGGSGRNTAPLNRRREASLDKTIDRAVAYRKAVEELRFVESKILWIERTPEREAAKQRADEFLKANGSTTASNVKPGDKVRWIVSGTDCTVVRVNKASVTVEMCGGHERLKFNEITTSCHSAR